VLRHGLSVRLAFSAANLLLGLFAYPGLGVRVAHATKMRQRVVAAENAPQRAHGVQGHVGIVDELE